MLTLVRPHPFLLASLLSAILVAVLGCAASSGSPGPVVVQLTSVSFASPSVGWVAASECAAATPGATANVCRTRIYRSEDGGQSWQRAARFLLDPTKLSFGDPKAGWLIGSVGQSCGANVCPNVVMQSTDSGDHWTRIGTTPLRLLDLASRAPKDAWTLAQGCGAGNACPAALQTTDSAGMSWATENLPLAGTGLTLDRLNGAAGWVGGVSDGRAAIVGTRDGGRSWQAATSPCQGDATRLSFISPGEGWVLCADPPGGKQGDLALFHTADGGSSWQDLGQVGAAPLATSTPLPAPGSVPRATDLRFTSAEDGWLSLASGILLRTGDGGRTWSAALRSTEPLRAIQFADSQHGWVIGTQTLWRTTDGGATWSGHDIDREASGDWSKMERNIE